MDRNRLLRFTSSLDRFIAKASGVGKIWRGFDRKPQPKRFQEKLTGALNRQINHTLTKSSVHEIYAHVQKEQTTRSKIKAAVTKQFEPIDKLISKDDVLSYTLWAGNEGGKAAVSYLGASGDFSLQDPKLKTFFEDRSNWLLKNIDETTLDSLITDFADAMDKGLTPYETQTMLTSSYEDDINPYRAEMITRTEYANAAMQTAKETYDQNGVEEWTWLTNSPTDEDCESNDGETRATGDTFPSGDDAPPVHPNCACDLSPVVPQDFNPDDAWLGGE